MSTILRVLVGSRAHGLSRPDSDYDYRTVFLHKTATLLSIGNNPKLTEWNEKNKQKGAADDTTGWEAGHFLSLATHCNPTILEVFVAPVEDANIYGMQLRELLPFVWHPKGVRDAFVGYGHNQRTKFLKDEDIRPEKYATAYLRVLFQAYSLLSGNGLPIAMHDTPVYDTLMKWRGKEYTKGEVIDTTLQWQEQVEKAYQGCTHTQDLDKVNKYLLFVRWRNWE